MKVYEILDIAFGMAGENLDDFPDKRLPVIWLNVAIAEAVKAENIIREKKGREKIGMFNLLTAPSDEVDMDEEICRTCLPLAVTSFLYSDRENDYLSARFRNRYIESLQNVAMEQEKSIYDCYGGVL